MVRERESPELELTTWPFSSSKTRKRSGRVPPLVAVVSELRRRGASWSRRG